MSTVLNALTKINKPVYYDHEAEFVGYNEDSEMVSVHIGFNIDRDDNEVLEFGRLVFKKVYEIEVVKITARYFNSDKEYKVTPEDLKWWNQDIKKAMQKKFERETA
ncbi:MAG: hypothetical protein AB7I27_00480 [Bacteriovoracaceae bacterium]